MKQFLAIALFLLSTLSFASDSPLAPDPKLSPGKLCSKSDPDYWRTFGTGSQAVDICSRNVSNSTKYQIIAEYGIDRRLRSQYKIDHVIPLNIGGSNDPSNLFPIHKNLMEDYERVEWPVYQAFRGDLLTTIEAQELVHEWKLNSWNESWIAKHEYLIEDYEEEFPNPYND